MKKATRILALVLCAVMCLGLFVGCGNKGKQNSDTPLVVGYSPFNSKFSPSSPRPLMTRTSGR